MTPKNPGFPPVPEIRNPSYSSPLSCTARLDKKNPCYGQVKITGMSALFLTVSDTKIISDTALLQPTFGSK